MLVKLTKNVVNKSKIVRGGEIKTFENVKRIMSKESKVA